MANRGVLGFENRICNGHFGSHSDSGFTTPNSLSNPSHPDVVKILSPNIFLGKNKMKNCVYMYGPAGRSSKGAPARELQLGGPAVESMGKPFFSLHSNIIFPTGLAVFSDQSWSVVLYLEP